MEVVSENYTVLFCLCPFHKNTESGVFAVNLATGEYYCHNPACGRYGDNLVELVMWVSNRNIFEARRFVKKRGNVEQSVAKYIEDVFSIKFEPFDQAILDRLYAALPGSPGHNYMRLRGFTDETLDYFYIGWSQKQQMVTTPLYNHQGVPLGFQARAIDKKQFKFSAGIQKNETLFNLNNAKRVSETVIFVEAPFDAMRIHQAGFPNVVALAGGSPSMHHYALLDRHFSKIIIMDDNDDPADYPRKNCKQCPGECVGHTPGEVLGQKLVRGLPNKSVYWAQHVNGCKDACDMTDEQITHSIVNAEPDFERQFA